MVILDLDLDAFVSPVATNRSVGAGRLADSLYEVEGWDEVRRFLTENCRVASPSPSAAVEHHDEVIAVLEREIQQSSLTPPFRWIHVDPHDDVGNACQDEILNSGNFLCECVRRNWIAELMLVQPTVQFPRMLAERRGGAHFWKGTQIPLVFKTKLELRLNAPPDYVLLARSPDFTPPGADELYDRIRSLLGNRTS